MFHCRYLYIIDLPQNLPIKTFAEHKLFYVFYAYLESNTFNLYVNVEAIAHFTVSSVEIGRMDSVCAPYFKYSQICIKRSPLGQRKSGLIRQVTS